MALLELLRGMDLAATVHGFPSSFRDWVAEETDVPREIAEAALAHTLENKVAAAYPSTPSACSPQRLWGGCRAGDIGRNAGFAGMGTTVKQEYRQPDQRPRRGDHGG